MKNLGFIQGDTRKFGWGLTLGSEDQHVAETRVLDICVGHGSYSRFFSSRKYRGLLRSRACKELRACRRALV